MKISDFEAGLKKAELQVELVLAEGAHEADALQVVLPTYEIGHLKAKLFIVPTGEAANEEEVEQVDVFVPIAGVPEGEELAALHAYVGSVNLYNPIGFFGIYGAQEYLYFRYVILLPTGQQEVANTLLLEAIGCIAATLDLQLPEFPMPLYELAEL